MEGVAYRDHKVLYIDDEKEERACFELECGNTYSVIATGDFDRAHHILESRKICVIICDSRMPLRKGAAIDPYAGLHFFKQMRKQYPLVLRALITGIPSKDRCIPFDLLNEAGVDRWIDKLERPPWPVVVKELIEKHVAENLVACAGRTTEKEWFPGVVGDSKVMNDLICRIEQICDSGLVRPVLIIGESGVGKELVAKAIHNRGSRKDKPCYVFSKAEISGDMARAALFGYARGAFTGAYADTPGAFEMAHQGTLVIDDVQNLSLDVQSDLLRVLEQGTFRRLGAGEKERIADFQIICSINEDPDRLISRGRLRPDFYYRICSVTIKVPPLRERKECIPILVKQFIEEFNREADFRMGYGAPKHITGIESAALEMLVAHNWTRNNVRELKNTVLSAWINASKDIIRKEDLEGCIEDPEPISREPTRQTETPWNNVMKHLRKLVKTGQVQAVLWAHIISGGNMREAARLLGMTGSVDSSRVRLHHFIRKHGLETMIEQRTREILHECVIKAEGNVEKAGVLLRQQLTELLPYAPTPFIDGQTFEHILKKFKLA